MDDNESGTVLPSPDPGLVEALLNVASDGAILSAICLGGQMIAPRVLAALGMALGHKDAKNVGTRIMSAVHSSRGAGVGLWVLIEVIARQQMAIDSPAVASTMMRHAQFELAYYLIETGLMVAPPVLDRLRGGQGSSRRKGFRGDQLLHHGVCIAGFLLYIGIAGRFQKGPAAALTSLLLLQHASTPLLHLSWLLQGAASNASAVLARDTASGAQRAAALRTQDLLSVVRPPFTAFLAAVFLSVRVLGWPALFGAYSWARRSQPHLPEPRSYCYIMSLVMLGLNLYWVKAGMKRIVGKPSPSS